MATERVLRSLVPLLICFALCLSSCTRLLTTTVIQPAVGNLQQQTNLDLVCEGAPAYLLMIDSMLVSSPENSDLLMTGAQSYSAYASALAECATDDDPRIGPLTDKAKLYGRRLLAQYLAPDSSQDQLAGELARLKRRDVPKVFWATFGWLSWVKAQKGSPEAIADLLPIEKIMTRLLELDEAYQGGAIHLFFGAYYAAKPAMFGGRPDLSRIHFEKALQLSGRKFLMVQTTYAETLARATMDKKLYDSLLHEVLAFDLDSAPEYALSNRIAVSRAKRLLREDYFAE